MSLHAIGLISKSAKANCSSLKNLIAGDVFQIATFKETTVTEIAEKIKILVERENGKTVNIIHTEKRLGDVKRNFSDISKAMNLLGFKPVYDLDKGLYETWKAFQSSTVYIQKQ